MALKALLGRLSWFIVVGGAAAAVHFAAVVALVRLGGWLPLVANVAAWLIAFIVSFTGHWSLTFRNSGASARQAVGRFFLVSAAGFALNEATYALLLATTTIRFDVALFLVLVGVAVMTYVLSARWAFRKAGH